MTSPSLPENIEQLLTQYENALDEQVNLLSEHAVLWARHAHGGTADRFKESAYQRLKARLRKKYADAGAKVTETRLDEETTASSAWLQFLQDHNDGRESYLRSKARVDQASNRIRLLSMRLRLLGAALSGLSDQGEGEDLEGGSNAS